MRPVLGTVMFPGPGRDSQRKKLSWPHRMDGSWCRPSPDPRRLATRQHRSPGVGGHVNGLAVQGLRCARLLAPAPWLAPTRG